MHPTVAALAALLVISVAAPDASAQRRTPRPSAQPTNVVYFITDGFGPASVTFAREYMQATTGRRNLAFDPYLVGALQTWATDSRVTDSAAGGTALATGHKTYNGAIAVDTAGRALATLLEAAQDRGMATGVVVTSRITHATPACFTAHVGSRAEEDEIARQQMRLAPDVMMGGGLRHFLPADVAPGRRRDGLNLLDSLRAKGFTVATDRAGFDRATRAPFVGLFAADHMAYDVDRDAAREPSLEEMTEKALAMLQGRSPRGFFLMVEASRIDHAAHGNDAAAHLFDILAYERAFQAALDFQRTHPGTLVVATSDHETGGLTLGRNLDGVGRYYWHPEVFRSEQASYDVLLPALRTAIQTDTTGAAALAVLANRMGLYNLSEAERADLVAALRRQPGRVQGLVTEAIARRATIQWTTGGHTAVDVNVYAAGPGADRFRGNRPNDAMGRTVAQLLGLDLDALTTRLRRTTPVYPRGAGE
ncbi:MAG: alkaline phosphatase [Rhodothermales bacterium]|nr:alkaline phosphatase [Rhodothermales bacterium]